MLRATCDLYVVTRHIRLVPRTSQSHTVQLSVARQELSRTHGLIEWITFRHVYRPLPPETTSLVCREDLRHPWPFYLRLSVINTTANVQYIEDLIKEALDGMLQRLHNQSKKSSDC